uniref:mitogen-activated protein kinase n=1 Tax=Leptobrachium leishanense TaxID=445787 RepID=A0A8C5R7R7_9ANUR
MDSVPRKGFYRQDINKTKWEVPQRYKQLKDIGSGAYGTVCSARDVRSRTGETVAIKKLIRPFQSKVHAKRAYRELRLLKNMNHENVSKQFVFNNSVIQIFSYMVMPFIYLDLGRVIKMHKLNQKAIGYLLYQILRGFYLKFSFLYLQDIKPSNIGVNENYEVKILDFGLARQTEPEMTGYVVTRWYRAPEVILNWMHYNQTVDIWSVGCILAEMITGHVLFPGGDCILWNMLYTHYEIQQSYFIISITFTAFFFHSTFLLEIDLLEKMLELDPESRITATQCLAHPYLEEYQDSDPDPPAEKYDDSFESLDLPIHEWKSNYEGEHSREWGLRVRNPAVYHGKR